jgi:hypothetical protein
VGYLFGTFSAVGRLVMGVFRVGRSLPWDVLRVGRFKSWTFSDRTFLEWDVSRAGPFVCAPPCLYSPSVLDQSISAVTYGK